MNDHPFVLADQDRLELFAALGRSRLFRQAQTWTDADGVAWMGVRVGTTGVGFTWLGPAWVHDPELRQEREAEYHQRCRMMEQAGAARHRRELAKVRHRLRHGGHAERLLWATHRAILSHGTSLLHLPDTVLAAAIWGHQPWPRHWRGDLLRLLGNLCWLHDAPWPEDGMPAFGLGTALVTRAGDLRGTADDACADDCPERHLRPHHHLILDVGPGFLGILEQFGRHDPDSGTRSYHFPIGGPKSEGPVLWTVGKTGLLRTVFLPAVLGEPNECATLTVRQHKLVQALVRETTRAKRRNRKDVSEPEVFNDNLVPSFTGKKLVACPLLTDCGACVGFNGNRKRKGLGYKLSTSGGWLGKAGYDLTALADFLGDLQASAALLGLTVVGVDRSSQFAGLDQMRALVETPVGRRALDQLHVRIYTRSDYAQRWTAFFGGRSPKEAPSTGRSTDAAVAALVADMAAKGISRRKLARALREDPSFLSKILSGKKPWPKGLLEKARKWVARQRRRRQARPLGKSSRPMASAAKTQVPTLDLALDYLQRGWAVLPIEPGTKKPYVRWKPYQERLPTEKQVTHWFSEWPDAGIGLVLGPVSGVLALDVDGEEAYGVLLGRLGKEPRAPKVLSGSAKPCRFHLFFQHPDVQTKAKHTPWHAHLEFRGHKGILVLPPSLHPSGNRYAWAEGQSCDDLPLPELPPEILKALTPLPPPKTRPQRAAQRVKLPAGVDAGQRTLKFLSGAYAEGPRWNDRLFSAACDLCGRDVTLEVAEPLLLNGARPWNVGEEELARRTIESAYSKPREPGRF